MAYTVRLYRDGDAQALTTIIRTAIKAVGPRAYNEEQVAAWLARHPTADRFRQRVANGDVIFVATDSDGEPVAYSLLVQDGHLDHLYCHPDHTKRGLAEKLLTAAEAYASSIGLSRLYTEASELARPAFERAGYSTTHRRDFAIEHDGKDVPIHNYAMEKALD